MSKQEPREWQDFTQKAMELAGVSQSELARRLSKKLGKLINQSSVSSRVKLGGKAPGDEDELKAWADALKLDGQHRERFLRLAYLERTPIRIQSELLAVMDRLDRNERKIAGLERILADKSSVIDRLTTQLLQSTEQAAALMQRLGG